MILQVVFNQKGFKIWLKRVLLFTFQGTHWLTEIVLLILADADLGKVNRNAMDQVFEMTLKIDPNREPITGYKVAEGWPTDQPRVMLSHLCAELLPPQVWHKKGAKVISQGVLKLTNIIFNSINSYRYNCTVGTLIPHFLWGLPHAPATHTF